MQDFKSLGSVPNLLLQPLFSLRGRESYLFLFWNLQHIGDIRGIIDRFSLQVNEEAKSDFGKRELVGHNYDRNLFLLLENI